MKTKREHITVLVFACLVLCILCTLLLYTTEMLDVRLPTSYIWVMDKGESLDETLLVKMCSNGTRLLQVQFGQSGAIGIDPHDGSIWAPELNDAERLNFDQIVKIDNNGNVIKRIQGYRTSTLAVDPKDGSIWIGLPNEDQIVKLDSKGEKILSVSGFSAPASLSVDPRNSSVWVADGSGYTRKLVHLTADGAVLFEIETSGFFSNAPHQIAIDPHDGTIWYTGFHSGKTSKLSADGQLLAEINGFDRPVSVTINPSDGSSWVADYSVDSSGAVVKINSAGKIILKLTFENPPRVVGVNPFDETVWVGIEGAMVIISDEGEILKIVTDFTLPKSIAFIESGGDLIEKLKCVFPYLP